MLLALLLTSCIAGVANNAGDRERGGTADSTDGVDGTNGATGDTAGTTSTGTSASTGTATGTTSGGGSAGTVLLPARIRRLTNTEYDLSVQALLGTTKKPSEDFVAPDTPQNGFSMNAAQVVDPVWAADVQKAAQELADEAVQNHLSELVPCASTGGDDCAKQFIADFGAKAYRRPLTADEADDLFTNVYQAALDGGTFADGIDLVIDAILQSAGFLYVTEIGDGAGAGGTSADSTQASASAPGTITMSPNEIASELSYLFLGAPPDADLLAAADQLTDPAVRETQARRLLADPRAPAQMARMIEEWLGLNVDISKDSATYPSFAGLKADMKAETGAFIREVLFGSGSSGTVDELFSADYTVASATLAQQLYGVAPASTAGGRVSLSGTNPPRRGLLDQGWFLSVFAHENESAPVLRGVAVLRRVACIPINSPSAELRAMIKFPPVDPNATTLQRFKAHEQLDGCSGCHTVIDSIGFTFEGFDGMGSGRPLDSASGKPTENGIDVDTSTVVSTGTELDGSYTDSAALVTKLAGLEATNACMARHLFEFASAQSDPTVEQAFLDAWTATPADQHGNLVDALIAYVKSPMFVNREVQP